MMMNSERRRKEIYTYQAPWLVYAMNWSVRMDNRFRLAVGSFLEDYTNKIEVVQLNEDKGEFETKGITIIQFDDKHSLFTLLPLPIQLPYILKQAPLIIRIQPQKSCGIQTKVAALQISSVQPAITFACGKLNLTRLKSN
jgi:hypothetical protein